MKLSILIPTYNCDCRQLVKDLLLHLPEDCEIVVGDDCSSDKGVKESNRELQHLNKVTYWESPENLGRARMRNRLTKMAKGEYLLFIDSDARLDDERFIPNYLACLPTANVVCGGYFTDLELPSPQVSLRWKYEKTCEKRLTAKRRSEHPYQNLSTFNIMMPRSVAETHPYDESISRYGYEDTLLGQELEEAGIRVKHIDNPLVHLGLDTNEQFLKKTEEAMHTLFDIRARMGDKSRLLKVYNRMKRCHLTRIIAFAFRHTCKSMRKNLLGANPSIRLFNFYKLGYYCNLALSQE